MSSSAISRGIRRKKSSLGEVKICVVGSAGVGKTALTVRFLTKRYIGEYDHQNENRYKHEMMVDGEPIIFEILDTCPKSGTDPISPETLGWADGFVCVYSITDRQSFNYIKRVKQQLSEFRNGGNTLSVGSSNNSPNMVFRDSATSATPIVLVANKVDLIHLRQISTEEGEILAKDLDSSFFEVAASEQVLQVAEVFHEVCREIQTARRKTKQSLLDRVFQKNKVYSRGKSDSAVQTRPE